MRLTRDTVTTIHLTSSEVVLLAGLLRASIRSRIPNETEKDFAKRLLLNHYIPDEEKGKE